MPTCCVWGLHHMKVSVLRGICRSWIIFRQRLLPLLLALTTLGSILLMQVDQRSATATQIPNVPSPAGVTVTPANPSDAVSDRSSSLSASSVDEHPKGLITDPNSSLENSSAPQSPSETLDVLPSQNLDPNFRVDFSNKAQRQQTLIQADRLYQAGQLDQAELLYRLVKPEFSNLADLERPEPFSDPEQLSPAGQVFWREAKAGQAAELETRIMVPLKLLVKQHPEFIPGQVALAEALKQYETPEAALEVLEKATSLYPNEIDLVRAKVTLLAEQEQWLEASLTARQFALLNPDDPDSVEMQALAQKNLERFQGALRERVRGNAIASVLTGAATFAVTGSPLGPINALQAMIFLLQGESGIGASITQQALNRLEMVDDPMVTSYVNEIGQKLARLMGRDEFQYEFHVVAEPQLNAFALPGGKVFINSGAIAKASSEAELAGLLGHELAHAVLSHGFQQMTEAAFLGNLTQMLPLGGTLTNLVLLSYSRDMERQADLLGTRVLVTAGYAADGLHNLMVTMAQQNRRVPIRWLSTHPMTDDRVTYLEELIQRNGYNRYAFEGVERHSQVQARLETLAPGEFVVDQEAEPS